MPMFEQSSRFDDSAKEEIRSRIDIGEVVGRYVGLKQAGQNLKGLCPFHKEKTPSFTVNPSRGFFHCFGCGKGGDVFTFVSEIEGVGFAEALTMLAEEAGVALTRSPRDAGSSPQDNNEGIRLSKTELLSIHKVAAKFFYESMRNSQEAISYLKGRGLRPEIVREFLVGYAPEGWSGLVDYAAGLSIAPEKLVACGLALKKSDSSRPYDRFRNRVIFPIFDLSGRPIAFGGRGMTPDAQPKYLNSPETNLYRKSKTLYGLHATRGNIKQSGEVLVVEGYMDYLSLYQQGVRNIVATCGTALTPDHANILGRFAPRITLVFDGDAAGQEAAVRAATILAPFPLDVRVLLLPQGEDPDTFVQANGPEKFRDLVAGSMRAFSYLLKRAMARVDIRSPHGKSSVVRDLLPILNELTDPILQSEFAKEIAQHLGIAQDLVTRGLRKTTRRPEESAEPVPENILQTLEGKFIQLLFTFPDLVPKANQRILPQTLTDPRTAELYSLLLRSYENGGNLQALQHIETPEIKRILSLISVSPFPSNIEPEEELVHCMRLLERKYVKRRLGEIRMTMRSSPDIPLQKIREEQLSLTARLAELDRER